MKNLDFRVNSPFSLNSRGSGGIWEDLEGFQWILKAFPYEMSPKLYPPPSEALASTRKHSKTFCSIPAHPVHPFATRYGPENTISGVYFMPPLRQYHYYKHFSCGTLRFSTIFTIGFAYQDPATKILSRWESTVNLAHGEAASHFQVSQSDNWFA